LSKLGYPCALAATLRGHDVMGYEGDGGVVIARQHCDGLADDAGGVGHNAEIATTGAMCGNTPQIW
jgi:hypothetical protein